MLSEYYESIDGHWHHHQRAQLIHANGGVLSVQTETGRWLVPPQRAVWILPGQQHRVSAKKAFWLRTLYIEPDLCTLPSQCCVVAIDPLLDALLREASLYGPNYPAMGAEQRLMQVILDRLPRAATIPTYLAQPKDHRLVRLTEILQLNPLDNRDLAHLAADCGITARTAARLFLKDTGLTFGQWRQQLRLLLAIERLGMGEPVTQVALEVGYADVSAFIAVFKAAFGTTPARYFKQPASSGFLG